MITLLSIFFINSTPVPSAEGATGATAQEKSFSLDGGKTISVNQFQFQGNNGITTEQLQSLLRPYSNTPLAESDLDEIKTRILLLYSTKGYPNAVVTIPPNQKGKTLTIQIKEGKKIKS